MSDQNMAVETLLTVPLYRTCIMKRKSSGHTTRAFTLPHLPVLGEWPEFLN